MEKDRCVTPEPKEIPILENIKVVRRERKIFETKLHAARLFNYINK